MFSHEIIVRLRRGGWYVVCETRQDVDLLLQICQKAGIKWINGSEATKWIDLCPEGLTGFKIGSCRIHKGLTYTDSTAYDEFGLENITDWFFNTIRGVKKMKIKMIRSFEITCTECGCEAIEYHYSDKSIHTVCFGRC